MAITQTRFWKRRNAVEVGVVIFGIGLLFFIAMPNLHRVSTQPMYPYLESDRDALKGSTAPPPPAKTTRSSLLANAAVDEVSETLDSVAGAPVPSDRKIVATSTISLTVESPTETADKIRLLAQNMGGYVESSQVNAAGDTPSANITIRVPATRIEEAKATLRNFAVKVESETTAARDVTRDYVDMEARLRVLRATEAQYLSIMKSAAKVKDMLEVSEKLAGVRGDIERQQAEFVVLSKQVETVAISIGLQAPLDTAVLGMNWRPLYELKVAARDALSGLANYVSRMMGLVLYLPVILLWGATVFVGLLVSIRAVRWAGIKLEILKPAATTPA